MPYNGSYRSNPKAFERRYVNEKKKNLYRKNRTKKLVTGQEPTLIDKIASGVGSVARLATAVAPMIAAINTEHKYYDQTASVTSYTPGTNDQLINLTQGINQGTTDSERIGNSILARDLSIRMAINFPATIGSPNVLGLHCRWMLICWKDNLQDNVPDVNKIFEAPNNLYSPVNRDYSDQLVVIKDKFFTLDAKQSVANPIASPIHVKFFKKIEWHMRFNGSGTTSGTLNHIYLILRSSATGASNAMNTTYYSRLNYTDN